MGIHRSPSERHLFFDNQSIEMIQDLTRVMHSPVKTGPPIIYKDKPWEALPYFGNSMWTVLHDPAEGLFRCWYEDWVLDPDGLSNSDVDITDPSVSSSRILYAESRDGIEWDKPSLGVVREDGYDTNIVLGDSRDNPDVFGSPHVPTVIDDPLDGNPSRRFKMIFQHISKGSADTDSVTTTSGSGAPQVLQSPIRLASSPDGIHWTMEPLSLNFGGLGPRLGDGVALSTDLARGEYVLHTRHPYAWLVDMPEGTPRTKGWSMPYWPENPALNNKRRTFRTTSNDLIHWNEPYEVFAADDEDDNLDDSFYSFTTWPLSVARTETKRHPHPGNDLHVGIVNVFHQTENVLDAQLAYSRNGLTWQRAGQRQPFLHRGSPGDWDEMMSCVPTIPIVVGDELNIYYGGSNSHHDWWVVGTREGLDVPEAKDISIVQHGIGLAKLRVDGFVSLRTGPVREGLLVTPSMAAKGTHLLINANCQPGGYIDVEVTDQQGRVIPGLSRAEVVRFNGNAVGHRINWSKSDLWSESQIVKLRFWMRNSDLYSFSFSN
ncbi:MAG: hypothetical protein QGF12_06135 [SAR202 cluster bacterium]|nr:hypothetical protein [SAR202 cluster bacterium]